MGLVKMNRRRDLRKCRPTSRYLNIVIVCNFISGLLLYLSGYLGDAFIFTTYITRPLWGTPMDPPFSVIEHYYAEGVPIETLCSVHGWAYKKLPNKVIDAIIFANELDLLEIRLHELYPVVDKFFIVESDKTFTNKPKPLAFQENRARFAFAEDKIVYGFFEAPPVSDKEAMGFTLEDFLREYMTQLLLLNGVSDGDIVIMADVDEIPSRHTISLFRNCEGYPTDIHLGMKNYLYSFEFPLTHQVGYVVNSPNSYAWRPQIHQWRAESTYYHSRSSPYLLADAGWHCSFCFRYLHDFTFKMTSYSHSDRVRHAYFLDPARIQRIVCDGADMYDMPPETFTYFDMVVNWYNPPKTLSGVHLPIRVVERPEEYAFLLPGGCIREE